MFMVMCADFEYFENKLINDGFYNYSTFDDGDVIDKWFIYFNLYSFIISIYVRGFGVWLLYIMFWTCSYATHVNLCIWSTYVCPLLVTIWFCFNRIKDLKRPIGICMYDHFALNFHAKLHDLFVVDYICICAYWWI